MRQNAISISNITKSFGKTRVLEGINLQVKKGTMLALLGPNGAGKTTTVRILSTLLKPDSGEAMIDGMDVVHHAHSVRHVIGLTGQYAAVDEILSGRENLEMFCRLYHLSRAQSKKRAQELLEKFDLVDAADKPVKNYSGGMKRRLDLASSLVATPPILFLDEPTTGLDPRSRLVMWDIINDLKKNGTTILLTTQYLEEADKLADRIAVLDKGKIIAEGTADELKSKVGSERIEMVIEKSEDFENALKLLETKGIQSNKSERKISVPTDGNVKAVVSVLDTLNKAGIELDAMSVHKPTLDDVFMHITGRTASNE
jgi:ABC-2 type transport system ATP-binding protein